MGYKTETHDSTKWPIFGFGSLYISFSLAADATTRHFLPDVSLSNFFELDTKINKEARERWDLVWRSLTHICNCNSMIPKNNITRRKVDSGDPSTC